MRSCITLSVTVQPQTNPSGPQFPTKWGKPARPGFPPGVIKCIVALKVFAKRNGTMQVDARARSQRSHRAQLRGDWADNRKWHAAEGTWQVSGHCVPRRLVWAAFPAAHATFPAGPTAGQAPLLMGRVGGHLALAQPGGPPTPCFVRRVWNVLGRGAQLPGETLVPSP